MSTAVAERIAPRSVRLTLIEPAFFALFLALRLAALIRDWRRLQGFDAVWYLETFDHVHWFGKLPGVREFFVSYHPPFSYLLQRLLFAVYPDRIVTSQVLSSASMIFAFVFLRLALRRIGVLTTVPGICFLYVAASLPLCVFLGRESTYEPLVLTFALLTLLLSIVLFWDAPSGDRPAGGKQTLLVGVLACGLAAGLFTKFTGLFSFATPFLVILARARGGAVRKNVGVAIAACVLAVAVVGPFYYLHYYRAEHMFFPITIEWMRPDTLRTVRLERDAHPVSFILHMLRVPGGSYWGTNTPVTDSLVHSVWLQLWKRDGALGPEARTARWLGDVYLTAFCASTIAGTVLFLTGARRRMAAWTHLGWILAGIGVIFLVSLARFGYEYPVWDWRVFKAKYVVPGLLWIPYATALVVDVVERRAGAWRLWLQWAVLGATAEFMALNYLVPVY